MDRLLDAILGIVADVAEVYALMFGALALFISFVFIADRIAQKHAALPNQTRAAFWGVVWTVLIVAFIGVGLYATFTGPSSSVDEDEPACRTMPWQLAC